MANKKSADGEKSVVTRIKAKDSAPRPAKKQAKASKSPKQASKVNQPTNNPFVAFGRYVQGAWQELRQVHWPTRSATWSLTGAVLAFSLVFAALILLLDAGFQLLFEQILK